ncbi:hypothetical protein RclHR1_08210003 [Rhizophagus clarus]|uniref:Uncharacterized protein n=1 Tax=Rhizophagus clarus TaxID=94130 RepID=A0A2Z6RZM7_9GLOM|nr:hypothetical protein RclHR1_08210003 [Rhizophagus clarus]
MKTKEPQNPNLIPLPTQPVGSNPNAEAFTPTKTSIILPSNNTMIIDTPANFPLCDPSPTPFALKTMQQEKKKHCTVKHMIMNNNQVSDSQKE